MSFRHQHTCGLNKAQWIEKIMAQKNLTDRYEVVKCQKLILQELKLLQLKMTNTIETYGSALKGFIKGFKDGNCNTWYVLEMAEKRALEVF